jgi:hypothetical protein
MCCFAALFAWISPRLAIFMAWVFANDRTSYAFQSFWIALLGFLLLPWTTLAWIVCYATPATIVNGTNIGGGVSGFGYIVVGFALLVDIGSYTSGARAQRQRSQVV